MDEKTLRFLKLLRVQVRAAEQQFRAEGRFEEDRRNVYTAEAARELGMEHPEYERRLTDLVRDGYLYPHPNPSFERQGAYRISDEGIARADAG